MSSHKTLAHVPINGYHDPYSLIAMKLLYQPRVLYFNFTERKGPKRLVSNLQLSEYFTCRLKQFFQYYELMTMINRIKFLAKETEDDHFRKT